MRDVSAPEAGPLSPFALALAVGRHLHIVLVLPMVLFAMALGMRAAFPPGFRSESRVYLPPSASAGSRFAGIAAQFGVSLGGLGGGSDPLALYVELLAANEIHREVLLSRHLEGPRQDREGGGGRQLLEILGVDGSDSTTRLQRGVADLRRRVEVSVNKDAGTIRVRVSMPTKALAESVNRALLSTVNTAAVELHREKAQAERVFVEQRMRDARRELDVSDQAVLVFRSRNRQVPPGSSAEVEFERLQREAALRKDVFLALAQSYEQARIEEVRNTPVFAIIDVPESSAVPRGRTRDLLIWVVIGLVLGVSYAVGVEAWFIDRARAPEKWGRLSATWRGAFRRFHGRPTSGDRP